MSRVVTTLAVFITIEGPNSADARDAVDDALDVGLFQDAINDQLSTGRVKCAVVRYVGADLLTEHDANPDPEVAL